LESATKKTLARLLWPRFSLNIELLNRNAQMHASLQAYEKHNVQKFSHRMDLYPALNARLGNCAISYLEFGVWKGESLRKWTEISIHPESRFWGFDSFEGLPEIWEHALGRMTGKEDFDLAGEKPFFADPRVELVKGWFQNTLPGFLLRSQLRHPIVLHIDCDLHSSTLYVLATLNSLLQSGDIVIFDEYNSPSNEYLAWEEYQRAFMRYSECIAMSNKWAQAVFMFK
jgi:hypothetical protein